MTILFIVLHLLVALLGFSAGYFHQKSKRYKKDYELEHMRYLNTDARTKRYMVDIERFKDKLTSAEQQLRINTQTILTNLSDMFMFGYKLAQKARTLYLRDLIQEPIFTLVNEFVEKSQTEIKIPTAEEYAAMLLVVSIPLQEEPVIEVNGAMHIVEQHDGPDIVVTDTFGKVDLSGDPMLVPGYAGEVSRESTWGMQEEPEFKSVGSEGPVRWSSKGVQMQSIPKDMSKTNWPDNPTE